MMRQDMKIKHTLCILIVSIFFASFAASAQEMDALDRAYKEQYVQYTNEIAQLKSLVDSYGKCIAEKESIDNQMTSLYEDYRLGRISKRDSLPKRMELTEANFRVLTEALNIFNEAKGEQRSDISIGEIKMDQELSRKRIKELSDKKQELKIKVLERKGALPSWWVD